MNPKLKSTFFTDTIYFEAVSSDAITLNAIIKNDQGEVCKSLEAAFETEVRKFNWTGFNEFPYGEYTLEMNENNQTRCFTIVKRV